MRRQLASRHQFYNMDAGKACGLGSLVHDGPVTPARYSLAGVLTFQFLAPGSKTYYIFWS